MESGVRVSKKIKTRGLVRQTTRSPKNESTALRVSRFGPAALKRRFLEHVPEIHALARCEVDILLNRDSAHIGPDEWIRMAAHIQSKWKDYDGIVLLHGTDTLAYTASALSFLLRPCKKPVVITGAQRPLASLRSDARRNLISAVEIAAYGPRPLCEQVMVFFDDALFQGNRVRKQSASDFSAFHSPKAPPLAWVGTSIRYNPEITLELAHSIARKSASKTSAKLRPLFNRNIALLHVSPGMPSRAYREQLLPSLDGLVLITYPSGTAPTHEPEFLELLKAARVHHIPVVVVAEGTTAGSGALTHPSAYEAGRELLAQGCLWAGNMTPECAYVKMSWILGNIKGPIREDKDTLIGLIAHFESLWDTDFAAEGTD